MSKEVLFAGILGVVCVILVLVAFIFPKHAPVTPKTDETASASDAMSPESDSSATGSTATASAATTGTFTGQTGGSATGSSTTSNLDAGPIAPTTTFPTGGTTGGSTFSPGNATFTGGGTTGSTGYIPPSNYPPVAQNAPPTPTAGTTGDDGEMGTEKVHVIAANETLGEISKQYYNTYRYWKKIVAANPGLDPNALKVGQKITIPALSPAASTADAGTPSAAATGGADTYTVQKDDSFYKIAQKALGKASRWKEIEKLNNVAPEDLRVGQVLKLPPKDAATDDTATSHTDTGSAGAGGTTVHIVAAGETLSDISKQYYGTTRKWHEIIKANPGVDAESLRVGQKLNIPASGESATPGATAGESTGPGATSALGGGEEHEYVIQPGDGTLRKIAKKELGNSKYWTRIAAANPGIDPKHLRVGQKLKIPGAEGGEGAAAPAPVTSPFAPSPTPGFTPLSPAPTGATQSPTGFAPLSPAPAPVGGSTGGASFTSPAASPNSSFTPSQAPAPLSPSPSTTPAAPTGVAP